MKVVLLAAISLDGFIARANGDTDWVKDDEEWERITKQYGNMVIGRKTYEEIKSDLFEDVAVFVLSSDGIEKTGGITCVESIENLLETTSSLNVEKLIVCGGAYTNGSFIAADVVDEIILDIHDVILGEGTPLLGQYTKALQLGVISKEDHKSFAQHHYRVLKADHQA